MDSNEEQRGRSLEARVKLLSAAFVAVLLLWAGTVLWLVLRAPDIPPVLAVERLEIREPDGNLAFALANSARPTPATMEGRVIMADQVGERRHPHFIFFDGEGDEVGGLMLRTTEGPGGRSVSRFMTFDADDHQEALVLGYTNGPDGATSGLRIIDHLPGASLLGGLRELGLRPGFTRAELQAALAAIPPEERASRTLELRGATRALLGSREDGDVTLSLYDGEGRPRIVLEVSRDGEPSIRLLDASGEPVLRLPR